MSIKSKVSKLDTTEVRLYVAEDFREEANHKVSAIGLYVDNRVLLQISPNIPDPTIENPAAISSLCFLFSISDAPDEATVSIDVEGPATNGPLIPSQKLPANLVANAASLVIKMQPCVVTALGKRTFVVKVNEREFRFNYFLNRQVPAHQEATIIALQSKAVSKARPKKAVNKKAAT